MIALLNSPKFVDFRLLLDEVSDAFYLDLKQFLYAKNNYKMFEFGDHFDIEKIHIWGVTIFKLTFQKLQEFHFFQHGQQLDLKLLTKQLKEHFRLFGLSKQKSSS